MVAPAAKREAVAHLQTTLGMSERRACDVVGADRKSVRYRSYRADDGDLRSRLRELAQQRRRFTSGFRTREYQADMRRRGYHPADDSAHLDGSKLDLLPPPGRSMDWLKREVRRFRPDAVLNNEGDHLDVRFPGYYGAPAIGGAKAAGLRNPLAGMPPPPPGFRLDAR